MNLPLPFSCRPRTLSCPPLERSGWVEIFDEAQRAFYYHNLATDETTWVLPVAEPAAEQPSISSAVAAASAAADRQPVTSKLTKKEQEGDNSEEAPVLVKPRQHSSRTRRRRRHDFGSEIGEEVGMTSSTIAQPERVEGTKKGVSFGAAASGEGEALRGVAASTAENSAIVVAVAATAMATATDSAEEVTPRYAYQELVVHESSRRLMNRPARSSVVSFSSFFCAFADGGCPSALDFVPFCSFSCPSSCLLF